MKKIIYWLGVAVAVLATIGMVAHRFYNPDMTQVRWFIEFWYIWLAWFAVCCVTFPFIFNKDSKYA